MLHYEGKRIVYRGFVRKPERDGLEDLDIDGRIILKWILKIRCKRVHWISVTHDREKQQAAVNRVISLWFHNVWCFV